MFIEFIKRDEEKKCEACRAFYLFFARSLKNSIIQEHELQVRFYLSHDIKITLKSHFWSENVNNLPSFTQRYNGRHYVTFLNL